MLDRIRTAWRAFRNWCSAHWFEITGACIALLAAFGLARRRHKPAPVEPPSTDLVNAMREKREREAEEKRAEAEAHRQFAEEKIREADAELERVRNMPAEELVNESNELLHRLRKDGVILGLLAALSWPVSARAAEPTKAATSETKDSTSEVVKIVDPDGSEFFLVPGDFYRWLYGTALGTDKVKREAVPAFRDAYADQADSCQIYKDSVKFERGVADIATGKLAIANERLEQASRWFRSPRFLVPVGVVIGGLAVAGVVAVVTHD